MKDTGTEDDFSPTKVDDVSFSDSLNDFVISSEEEEEDVGDVPRGTAGGSDGVDKGIDGKISSGRGLNDGKFGGIDSGKTFAGKVGVLSPSTGLIEGKVERMDVGRGGSEGDGSEVMVLEEKDLATADTETAGETAALPRQLTKMSVLNYIMSSSPLSKSPMLPMGDKTSSQPMKDKITDASKEQTSGKSIASNDKLKDDGEMKDVEIQTRDLLPRYLCVVHFTDLARSPDSDSVQSPPPSSELESQILSSTSATPEDPDMKDTRQRMKIYKR
ncbi:uncharacterized protein LOC113473053, partial [Diaphorina citri]|uniref:Uncharacterized protein LOC113473053 n=1 Tax=Diaphorina citri TaxID=121845 RepID=A0A3Q0JN45_DIACI